MKGLNTNESELILKDGYIPNMKELKQLFQNKLKTYIGETVFLITERKGFDWSVDDDGNKECRFDVSDVAENTFDYTIKYETSCDIVRLEEIVLTGTHEVYLVNELDIDEGVIDTLDALNLEELFNLAILLEDAYTILLEDAYNKA